MSLRSPLGRVLGLGAAGEGVEHWWNQRVGSIALLVLTLWFIGALLALGSLDYASLTGWLRSPVNAVLTVLLVVAAIHHSLLGVQVVIEDYVGGKGVRIAALLASWSAHIVLGAIAAFAVLRIAFGGAA